MAASGNDKDKFLSEELSFEIWPPHEAFYIEAMLFSTKSALESLQVANRALDRSSEWKGNPELAAADRNKILDSVQSIVSCGAALSRYFWPARKDELHTKRARRLRTSLGVVDSSPLRNRDLRNLIEHFDEKLDIYLREGIVGHILPTHIGNRPEEQEVPVHLFRAYYTEVAVFEVLGQRFAIRPIIEEIARLHALLRRCSEQGSVLPRDSSG
jgi:hypothetical protein